MAPVEEKLSGASSDLLARMKLLKEMQDHAGARQQINSELWHVCVGPLVTLPQVGSLLFVISLRGIVNRLQVPQIEQQLLRYLTTQICPLCCCAKSTMSFSMRIRILMTSLHR